MGVFCRQPYLKGDFCVLHESSLGLHFAIDYKVDFLQKCVFSSWYIGDNLMGHVTLWWLWTPYILNILANLKWKSRGFGTLRLTTTCLNYCLLRVQIWYRWIIWLDGDFRITVYCYSHPKVLKWWFWYP